MPYRSWAPASSICERSSGPPSKPFMLPPTSPSQRPSRLDRPSLGWSRVCIPLRQFATSFSIRSIVFLDGDRRLVIHGKDEVLLYNLQSGQLETVKKTLINVDLGYHDLRVSRLASRPQGTRASWRLDRTRTQR